MKIRRCIYFLTFLSFMSCNSSNDDNQMQQEIQETKKQLDSLKTIIKAKEEQIVLENNDVNTLFFVTDNQALDYVKDYYSFYLSDWEYRGPILRRRDNNNFDIKLEDHPKDDEYFPWQTKIIKLTVYKNGEYKLIRTVH